MNNTSLNLTGTVKVNQTAANHTVVKNATPAAHPTPVVPPAPTVSHKLPVNSSSTNEFHLHSASTTPLAVCVVLLVLYLIQTYFFVTRVIFSRSESYYKSRQDKYVKVKEAQSSSLQKEPAEQPDEKEKKPQSFVQKFKSELGLFLRNSETNRILLRCLSITVLCRVVQLLSDAIGILDTNGGAYAFIESLPLVLSQIIIYTII